MYVGPCASNGSGRKLCLELREDIPKFGICSSVKRNHLDNYLIKQEHNNYLHMKMETTQQTMQKINKCEEDRERCS